MRTVRTILSILLLAGAWADMSASGPAQAAQSPENQVYQFMYSATRDDWADGARTSATAYLWIPEQSQRLRGLLILGTNVPEQMLAGNTEIRAAAAANDLGIVWSSPTFWYSKAKNEDKTVVAFLQQLLDGLAKTSGYDEVSSVPWLPIGESGHLLMVDALVEAAPARCIAGIWLKNPHLPPHDRTVPAFVVFGTAQEWGQDKADYMSRWQDTHFYDTVLDQRKQNPGWPLTFFIDGGSGHFDVSQSLVHDLSHYIDTVAKARLPLNGATGLRAIQLSKGYLADLPVGAHAAGPIRPYDSVPASDRALPWFFDREGAEEAEALAKQNWKAQSQLIGFTDGTGKVLPFDFNGITSVTPSMDPDGVTFHLHPLLLDTLPPNFLHAGEPLAKGPSEPVLEWMSGAVAPAGGDALRIALDRGYRQQAIYYVARAKGSETVRPVVQPIGIKLEPNRQGASQHIDFTKIDDVKVGTDSVRLRARSDQGLPVRFFVVAGPAKIVGGSLVFTAIPPRAAFPVAVTVAAWQWGRASEPKIQQADTVRQTFFITKTGKPK